MFRMEPGLGNLRTHFNTLRQPGWAPRVEPERLVAYIHEPFRGQQLHLRRVDAPGCVAIEDMTEAGLVGFTAAPARLPSRGCSEENAEPILVEDALAVVIPYGRELSCASQPLACLDKARNVVQGDVAERIDLPPISIARSDPCLHPTVLEC